MAAYGSRFENDSPPPPSGDPGGGMAGENDEDEGEPLDLWEWRASGRGQLPLAQGTADQWTGERTNAQHGISICNPPNEKSDPVEIRMPELVESPHRLSAALA